jgi:hypothetical protein
MATAVKQAIINGMCTAGSYVQGTDFLVDVEFSVGTLRVALYNKHNPTNLLFWNNAAGAQAPNVADLIVDNGGTGQATSSVFSLHQRAKSLFDFSVDSHSCSDTSQCGALSTDYSISVSVITAFYGNISFGATNSISGTPDTNNCSHAELVATLTGGSCTPTYAWTGPGTIYNPTAQTIYVTTAGTYEVDVTGCTGCGTLEDSEIVV